MSIRMSLIVALAVIVPLLIVLALAWPAAPVPTSSTGATPQAQDSSAPIAANSSSASSANQNAPQAKPPAAPRPAGPLAPELVGGGAWINSAPLTLAGLKGRVVLIDFWTYGCYNCTNTLPYIKQWWSNYKDQGLVIVGVHTPEFASEKVLENVQSAVKREEIGWPVVQDNGMNIWRAYGNHYWPHFYLVDDRGQIIYDHIGEGAYDETERQIQAALAAAKAQ
jgi:thiol-disulfide isomerase/thioredoxin